MIEVTKDEARMLVKLLKLLRVHLRSALESMAIPGTDTVMPEDASNAAADLCDLSDAGLMVDTLRAKLKRRK